MKVKVRRVKYVLHENGENVTWIAQQRLTITAKHETNLSASLIRSSSTVLSGSAAWVSSWHMTFIPSTDCRKQKVSSQCLCLISECKAIMTLGFKILKPLHIIWRQIKTGPQNDGQKWLWEMSKNTTCSGKPNATISRASRQSAGPVAAGICLGTICLSIWASAYPKLSLLTDKHRQVVLCDGI